MRQAQLAGGMPADLVKDYDRTRFRGKAVRDLVEVVLHGLRVGVRHEYGRLGAALGTMCGLIAARPGGHFAQQPEETHGPLGSWPD